MDPISIVVAIAALAAGFGASQVSTKKRLGDAENKAKKEIKDAENKSSGENKTRPVSLKVRLSRRAKASINEVPGV